MQEKIQSGMAGFVQHFHPSIHARIERLESETPSSTREQIWEQRISRVEAKLSAQVQVKHGVVPLGSHSPVFVKKQALDLEGLESADHNGRIVGKLSFQPIRSTSLTLPEIILLVDVFVWGGYELGKIAPKVGNQEKEANSHTRVVETTTSPPRTPNSTPPWASRAGMSAKRKREQSPDQGRRSTPTSSPTGAG